MAKDPVCKKDVNPTEAAARVEYLGKTYYFCTSACHKAFRADPARYLRIASPAPAANSRHSRLS